MRDRPTFDLFVVSWLILFLELTCIRWFPSHVMFLTFFTNIVLLACFVGMSVGCLTARAPARHVSRTPLWLTVAVFAGVIVERFRKPLMAYVAIGDQANPDVIFFGAEAGSLKTLPFRIPLEVIAGMFFLLIATLLVGPGQEMGRAFNRVGSRARAYSVNLLGSLAGILSFAVCSYLEVPPVVWFAAVALGLGYVVYRKDPGETAPPARGGLLPAAFLATAVLLSVFTSGMIPGRGPHTAWSPYYRIDYYPQVQVIDTNLISHQMMEPREHSAQSPYALPYLFQRDVKTDDGRPAWPEFKRVLIVGAGSGNDVARALQWCPPDARIDAVEIDPVIQRLGAADHPDRPYQDPRVTVHLDDGRNFLRRAEPGTYDLVIFALVDSLVLQSGYSSLRLETYLFTEESFRDVRRALKPTGVYTVYNFFRHGWLALRLRDELRTAFGGTDPVALTTPALAEPWKEPLDRITAEIHEPQGFTAFFAGAPEVIGPLRGAFARSGNSYWFPWYTGVPSDTAARFGAVPSEPPPLPVPLTGPDGQTVEPRTMKDHDGRPIPPRWLRLRIAEVEESNGTLRPATDDWPFLYVRTPTIPLVTWRGVVLMVVLSVFLWGVFRPRGGTSDAGGPADYGLAARAFFLGAGFMLVETKAVVHMALLFGSTWAVNTVVFAAVLVMSLAGNLFAGWVKPRRLEPYFLGLFATLALGLLIPLDAFLGLERTTQVVGACALVFAPIAFAGVIFATTFGRSSRPERVFGANVAGALVGGLAENASVVLGFHYLLCVAVGFYLLAAAAGSSRVPTTSAGKGV